MENPLFRRGLAVFYSLRALGREAGSPAAQWLASLDTEWVGVALRYARPLSPHTHQVQHAIQQIKIPTAKVIVRNEHKYTWTTGINPLNIKRSCLVLPPII